jgi:broad specificity phosphatase PhoE
MDWTYHNWLDTCFDDAGRYVRREPNMAERVPERQNSPKSFYMDSPLTSGGAAQAMRLGEAMRASGLHVKHVFSSPALRSVETTHQILLGLNQHGVSV